MLYVCVSQGKGLAIILNKPSFAFETLKFSEFAVLFFHPASLFHWLKHESYCWKHETHNLFSYEHSPPECCVVRSGVIYHVSTRAALITRETATNNFQLKSEEIILKNISCLLQTLHNYNLEQIGWKTFKWADISWHSEANFEIAVDNFNKTKMFGCN